MHKYPAIYTTVNGTTTPKTKPATTATTHDCHGRSQRPSTPSTSTTNTGLSSNTSMALRRAAANNRMATTINRLTTIIANPFRPIAFRGAFAREKQEIPFLARLRPPLRSNAPRSELVLLQLFGKEWTTHASIGVHALRAQNRLTPWSDDCTPMFSPPLPRHPPLLNHICTKYQLEYITPSPTEEIDPFFSLDKCNTNYKICRYHRNRQYLPGRTQ
ncbi:hypothetical protein PROFUN_15784 [Planoprotostelium fungivorum]|uniref:Uncharacterized protein n=1 Tax=Planoprotostelium fungivorum TaxID=1890364 RepID=A0A2P6MT59_9EUKA|nr:hypothetical protein PROFUN_15784 [Planoprotostelium fungivorum]